jgi:anti-anti-sigma factor
VVPQGTIDIEVISSNAALVTLRGEHDLASRPQVATALAVARDCGDVLVDLTPTTFIDSSVINALLHTANALVRDGRRLELVIPPSAHTLRSLFEAMSVTRLLPLHDTRLSGAASIALADPAETTNPGLRIRALVQPIDSSIDSLEAQRDAA